MKENIEELFAMDLFKSKQAVGKLFSSNYSESSSGSGNASPFIDGDSGRVKRVKGTADEDETERYRTTLYLKRWFLLKKVAIYKPSDKYKNGCFTISGWVRLSTESTTFEEKHDDTTDPVTTYYRAIDGKIDYRWITVRHDPMSRFTTDSDVYQWGGRDNLIKGIRFVDQDKAPNEIARHMVYLYHEKLRSRSTTEELELEETDDELEETDEALEETDEALEETDDALKETDDDS
ncbi:hypothetical protein BJ508DRAFT_363474 [Ascobolus immersus RN42]|uniref:Uncharacterized protein n=1 Tax=Ascobolus immersus RN42 TaxID=1160509 RepID=A0A3N4HYT3_ASCIM|nr:hypothetical protein BJ508DRAFT_363474 [Ascobolus immersus RN42]